MIRTYSQVHRTDRYSQYSSTYWPIRPNGLVLVYELRDSGLESSCSHLIFGYCIYFEQRILDIQGTIESGFNLKRVLNIIKTYNQMHRTR